MIIAVIFKGEADLSDTPDGRLACFMSPCVSVVCVSCSDGVCSLLHKTAKNQQRKGL